MTECEVWTGRIDQQGYGRVGATKGAHVEAWEAEHGPVPDGLQVHHVCENRACVNVAHLQVVTRSEHQRIHKRKPFCVNGHAMTPANTYVRPDGTFDCRTCIRTRVKRYQARERSSA